MDRSPTTSRMTAEQIVEMLASRHCSRLTRPAVVFMNDSRPVPALVGRFGESSVTVYETPTYASVEIVVGEDLSIGCGPIGSLGAMSAYGVFHTELDVDMCRERGVSTDIPGWDIVGLKWRIAAVAPNSRTLVPFMGRYDQYLPCESPIPHMLAEAHTLRRYQPAEGDLSRA